MKRKFLIFLFTIISVVCFAIGFSACDSLSSENSKGSTQTSNETEDTDNDNLNNETEENNNSEITHTHLLSHYNATAATCTEDGNIEYWYCSTCGKYFSDKNCRNEIGILDFYIFATGHTATHTEQKTATCSKDGNIEYWYCSSCGKYFSDASCTEEITSDITLNATGHTATHTAYKSATCFENGNIEYWYCSTCEKYFSDSACTTKISYNSTVINSSHNFGSDDICTVCGEHKATDGLSYTLTSYNSITGYGVSAGAATDEEIYIPSSYNGYPVIAVKDRGFHECTTMVTITIPKSILTIGEGAFSSCSELSSIIFNEDSQLENIDLLAFANCVNLTTISLPDCVKYIGNSAFTGSSLTDITIPSGMTIIESGLFHDCSLLTNVNIGNNITSVGYSSFQNCTSLSNITLSGSITTIGSYAFYGCSNLTSVTLGSNITSIGAYAFEYCYKLVEIYNLSSLNLDSAGYVAYYAKNIYTTTEGSSNLKTQDGYVFYNDNSNYYLLSYTGTETQLTLPDLTIGGASVEYSIYDYAFYKNSFITSVAISGNITAIGSYAFEYCSVLKSVTIAESVNTVGGYAFAYCYSLESASINCKSLGTAAFLACYSLSSVTIGDQLSGSDSSWFDSCFRLIEVINLTGTTITAGSSSYGGVASRALSIYTQVPSEDSFTTIDDFVFYESNGVKYLINYAGSDTDVVLPDISSDYYIYSYAFYGFSSITSFTINGSNTYCKAIDGNLYSYDGTELIQYAVGKTDTSFTIPDGVTTITEYAFAYCTALKNVIIPSSVTIIAEGAFKYCEKLENVTLPEQLTTIGDDAFMCCRAFTKFVIPDSVKTIGNRAIYGCSSLTTVLIGNGVTSIGYLVCHECYNLKTVYYNGTAEKWNNISINSANSYLTSATRYYYAENDGTVTDAGNYWYYDGDGEIVVWTIEEQE